MSATATETKITISTLIRSVAYDSHQRSFVIGLDSGGSMAVPVDKLKMELHDREARRIVQAPKPTDEQLSQVEVWGGGRSIDIACIKQNFGLEQLLRAITS